MSSPNLICRIRSQITIEQFETGALLLRDTDLNLIVLNKSASDILSLTDGKRSVNKVAEKLAQLYDILIEDTLLDVSTLYLQLIAQGILESTCDNQGAFENG